MWVSVIIDNLKFWLLVIKGSVPFTIAIAIGRPALNMVGPFFILHWHMCLECTSLKFYYVLKSKYMDLKGEGLSSAV